jgi:hypothetical protein
MGLVLAETSAWTYVTVTYVATVGLLGGYAAWIIQRGRKVGRQLPPEDRKWSS